MKTVITILLALTLVAGVSVISHAGHDPMIIPYETQAMGYKSAMPIPGGGDLRHHLTGHMPYKKWSLWPGKGKMFEGTEPHGAFITVYVNDIALKSINKSKGMANNSIVLKENYTPGKKLAAITVMYKVKGYDPAGGDWFWVKYDPDFKVVSEGKVAGCMGCHAEVKGNDYIYTGKVTNMGLGGSTPGYGKPPSAPSNVNIQ